MTVSPNQLHYMQHALGLDRYGQGSRYRNHFISGPSCDNWNELNELVAMGFMARHEPRELFGGDCCFTVTFAGDRYVAASSEKVPKLTRSQRRYRDWMRADPGVPFGDWLKGEMRERAKNPQGS